jgi:hypothetical protein
MTEAQVHEMRQSAIISSVLPATPPKPPAIAVLPDSLLSDIFVLVYHYTHHPHYRYNLPRTLSSVSRLWRAIALSTRRLWDSVRPSVCIEHLSIHLERSGDLPIDVSLDGDRLGHIRKETLQDSFRLLQSNWCRIRDLQIDGQDINGFVLVLEAFNDIIQKADHNGVLRTISIDSQQYGFTNGRRRGVPRLILPHSQMLESIHLSGAGMHPTQLPYSYPLLQLHTLDITCAPAIHLFDSFFPVLDLMPNLVRLSLNTCRLWYERDNLTSGRPVHSILLSKLDTLSLRRTNEVPDLNMTFRTLDMPNLRSFTFEIAFNVQWSWGVIPLDWSAVFHRRALEQLELRGFSSRVMEGFLDQIGSLENLEEFDILPEDSYGLDNFIEEFARTLSGTAACCPKLRSLRVLSPISAQPMDAIEELMGARESLCVYKKQHSVSLGPFRDDDDSD